MFHLNEVRGQLIFISPVVNPVSVCFEDEASSARIELLSSFFPD